MSIIKSPPYEIVRHLRLVSVDGVIIDSINTSKQESESNFNEDVILKRISSIQDSISHLGRLFNIKATAHVEPAPLITNHYENLPSKATRNFIPCRPKT